MRISRKRFTNLKDLAAKGWIKQEQKQYAMHPVISEMLYAELQPTIENCNTLVAAIEEQLDEKEFSTLIWQEKETRIEYGIFLAKRLNEKNKETADLYHIVGVRLYDMSRYQKALKYQKKALKIRKRVLGERGTDTVSSYNSVGISYEKLGKRKKGLEYKEKALEIYKEELGERNVATATLYNNIGYSYFELGERKKGLSI